MRKVFPAFLLVVLTFVFAGCSLDDDGETIEFRALRISSAELPESFAVNNTYEINVTYALTDGCTAFEGFDVAPKDTTVREVVAIGSRAVEAQCTQIVTDREQSFLFKVVHDQPYLFRFWQGQDANDEPIFLEIEVPVN